MATTRVHLGNKPKKFTIATGDTVEVILPRAVGGFYTSFGGLTITAIPGSGGSLDVEYSTSPYANIEGGTATWLDWALGVTMTSVSDTLSGPITAVRATAATNSGTLEVVP